MITAFLIATLVLFVLSLGVNLITIAGAASKGKVNGGNIIGVFITLIMITWNIFALVSL